MQHLLPASVGPVMPPEDVHCDDWEQETSQPVQLPPNDNFSQQHSGVTEQTPLPPSMS